ncbi:MAG: hypothetical protein IPM77_14045 [Crocinitomicaceae bacterium]|nr:hypothetical protein [Crocinitomicaceae bacterium]
MADTTTLTAGTLAIPKHKFTIKGAYSLNEKHRFILSYIFQSEKISFEQTNSFTEEYNYITRPSTNLIDFTYQWNNIFGFLDFSTGVRNLLNIKNHYVYPMSGGYPTSMGMGLEIFAVVKIKL